MSCTTPVSLFAVITDTKDAGEWSVLPAGTSARSTESSSTRPASSTSSRLSPAPSWSTAVRAESRTAGCSIGETTSRPPGTARARPETTRASASVPPEVSSTSCASTPRAVARRARACASSAPTRRPAVCCALGFAQPPSPLARSSATCWATSGRTGAEAA